VRDAAPGVGVASAVTSFDDDDVIVRTPPASVAVPHRGQNRLPAGTSAWHCAQDTVADYRRSFVYPSPTSP